MVVGGSFRPLRRYVLLGRIFRHVPDCLSGSKSIVVLHVVQELGDFLRGLPLVLPPLYDLKDVSALEPEINQGERGLQKGCTQEPPPFDCVYWMSSRWITIKSSLAAEAFVSASDQFLDVSSLNAGST